MAEEKLKVLISGDVDGKFKTLFSKVNAINQKNGPFDFLLCVGNFFGDSMSGWEPYKTGSIKVPVPVYVLGPNHEHHASFYPEHGELGPNINFLGKRGVLSSSGLKIAYLSGLEGRTSDVHIFTEKDVTTVRDIAFRSKNFIGVDVLLTSEWPENVIENQASVRAGSRNVAWLACQLKPRYHFCGLQNVYHERAPYTNHADQNAHCTRFISLGKVGNDGKQKWLYAASLTPIDKMKPSFLYQVTTDQTSCPYSRELTSLNISKPESNQFFYDMNTKPEEKKRKRSTSEGEKRRAIDQDTCWFCLASPSVEKHLVISIGEEMYLALAKGGLTEEHVMILPIQHHQTSAHLPESAKKELKKFKSSLKKYFKKRGSVPVFFERNYKTSHLQMQVIPVPVECVNSLKELFISGAREGELNLDEMPHHAELQDIAPVGTPYFYVELPDGERLFSRCKKNFPLHFGRDILADDGVLNMPERINWRDCVCSNAKETEMALGFRNRFTKYDFTTE